MPTGGVEDVDLPLVGPAAQRVRVDAEDAARLAEGEPERAGHETSRMEDG